jgi:hypothetical protein
MHYNNRRDKFFYTEWESSSSSSSPLGKEADEFAAEFSAVTAPVPSSSWFLMKAENDNGLQVELAF